MSSGAVASMAHVRSERRRGGPSGAGASVAHVSSERRRGRPSGAGASVAHVRSERRRGGPQERAPLWPVFALSAADTTANSRRASWVAQW